MVQPITWRNVDAPNFSDASRALLAAGQSMNQGFDVLGSLLQRREAVDQANWQQQKTNNTQAFMDALYANRTPEALAAAQPALDQMRQGFGAQIDVAAARAAQDGRGDTLRQRSLNEMTFTDQEQAQRLRPLLQQAMALSVKNDQAGLAKLREGNPAAFAELESRYAAEMAKTGQAAEDAFIRQQREGLQLAQTGAYQDAQMRNMEEQRRIERAKLNLERSKAGGSSGGGEGLKGIAPLINALGNALEGQRKEAADKFKSTNMFGGNPSLNGSQNVEAYTKAIKDNYDPKGFFGDWGTPNGNFLQEYIAKNPTYTAVDPKTKEKVEIPWPTGVVARAARNTTSLLNPEEQFAKNLIDGMKDPRVLKDYAAAVDYFQQASESAQLPVEALKGVLGFSASQAQKKTLK